MLTTPHRGAFPFQRKEHFMKVKVLKLGEAATETEVQEGATIEHVIQASGFNRDHQTITLNGHPAFDTSQVQDGDVVTMNPHIKGGSH